MIINRIKFTVKRGHFQEAVAMLKTMGPASGTDRIYRTLYGKNDILTFEREFENLEQLAEATTIRWVRDEEGDFAEWYQITEASETEVLMLV